MIETLFLLVWLSASGAPPEPVLSFPTEEQAVIVKDNLNRVVKTDDGPGHFTIKQIPVVLPE